MIPVSLKIQIPISFKKCVEWLGRLAQLLAHFLTLWLLFSAKVKIQTTKLPGHKKLNCNKTKYNDHSDNLKKHFHESLDFKNQTVGAIQVLIG